jgi:peptide chain release factor 1
LVEIRAAEGGTDAKLLVADLFQIYMKWCRLKGFKAEMSSCSEAKGGFSILEFVVRGKGAYEAFLNEAGGHRFQRTPPTEKRGRRQTSTVTVAVLPLGISGGFHIDPADLRWEAKRGSGAGGQHRNVTESAVRVVHVPTGLAAECQDERSQHRNRKQAMEILEARLAARHEQEMSEKENSQRKNQVGSGMRGDKIRTYRFQDDRAVDHRTGKKVRLSEVLAGNLDLLGK